MCSQGDEPYDGGAPAALREILANGTGRGAQTEPSRLPELSSGSESRENKTLRILRTKFAEKETVA